MTLLGINVTHQDVEYRVEKGGNAETHDKSLKAEIIYYLNHSIQSVCMILTQFKHNR